MMPICTKLANQSAIMFFSVADWLVCIACLRISQQEKMLVCCSFLGPRVFLQLSVFRINVFYVWCLNVFL